MLKRMSSTGSPNGSSSPNMRPAAVLGGGTATTPSVMGRMTTPTAAESGDLSRAESARRVLEARRQKQQQKMPDVPGSSAPTPGTGTNSVNLEATTPTSQSGVSQMLGGRLLQGIHDILMVMDEKVEHLVTDVNNMRADFQGIPMDNSDRRLAEIQSKVDIGFATIFAQLKHLQPYSLDGDTGGEGTAHVPGSRKVDLILHTDYPWQEHERSRTSSSATGSSQPSHVHDLWEEMENMEKMGTEDLIACENPTGVETSAEEFIRPVPATGQLRSASSTAPTAHHLQSSDGNPEMLSPERFPPTEEGMTRISSSRLSSARNSRASRASSSPGAKHGARRRTSNDRVTFEEKDLEGSKFSLTKGTLNSSKSRVDDFAHFIKTRKRSSAQKLVWNLLEDPDLVRGGRTYGNLFFFLIIVSAVLPIIPYTSLLNTDVQMAILYALLILDCLFFLEVIVRFYGAPHRLRFWCSIHNWLDILSVMLPVGLKVHLQSLNLAADAHLDVEGVELALIVMVPVLRLLKLLRRFENSHLIKQAFREAIGALPSLLYCMMVLVVGFSAIIYALEPRSNVETMPRAIWFTMVTLTTVGYGDVVPSSPGGNIVVCILMVVSAMYMAMPLGIVGKAFGSVWDDRHRLLLMQRLRTRFSTVGYDPQDIPSLFCSYDENGDGELSMDEFRQMLQQLEVEAKDERAHDVFAAFDNDGSGAIDDSEFIKTLFPTAYKSMYKGSEEPNVEEVPNEKVDE